MDGPQPTSASEVLTVARPSSDPPVKGRNSSPPENSISARSSNGTCHFSNVPQSSTSQTCDARMLVPRGKFQSSMELEAIFERAGLTPLVLTKAEVSCAERTPGIKWSTFVKIFGGALNSEWPQCSKVPGYEDFACTTVSAQPFMPLVPGKPGLLLQLPAVIEAPQSNHDKSTFHIFSTMQTGGRLHYRGKYTKIPLPQIQFTWTKVSPKVRYNVAIKPHPHIMDAFLTLFSFRKGGSDGSVSETGTTCVLFAHA